MELTMHEKVNVVRLLRTMRRDKAYWLRYCIECLLKRDSDPDADAGLAIECAQKTLEAIEGLERWRKWRDWMPTLINGIPSIVDHPGFPSLSEKKQRADCIVPDDEEDQFYELVRMWRKEHPEPPKRPVYPSGSLDSDDDEDDED